jgi:hypothetical protein
VDWLWSVGFTLSVKIGPLFDLCSTVILQPRRPGHLFDLRVGSPFLMRGIGTMAKTQRMGIRLSQEERQQIQEAVRRLEYKGPSALVRQAIHNELGL